jgi:hypothetical protein
VHSTFTFTVYKTYKHTHNDKSSKLYIYFVMLDTLLLKSSLHFTQLHLTPLHSTCQHFTSSHLNLTPTTLHFPLIWLNPISISYCSISPHISALHLTSLLCTFRRFSSHIFSFHFTPFVIAFLILFLKILGLEGKIPNASVGSWFQFYYGPVYKGILPDIRSLLPGSNFPNMIKPSQIEKPSQPVACSFPSPFPRVRFKKCA